MKILKSWLQDHIVDVLPSDEVITEALTMKSSEVEGVESVSIEGKTDTVFDIKTLPDRSHYMLSHGGVAYDLCAIMGMRPKEQISNIKYPISSGKKVSVKIETPNCNRYIAIPIDDIDNKAVVPSWLKARLEAIGARSISPIVDATNYAMYDTGQPLHAFDADKVVGGIVVRQANEGEAVELLPERVLVDSNWVEKERKITLTKEDMVIADDTGILAIAGVKGGQRAVVTENTKNIILESASFNPVAVRKTSTKYGIRNDSSKRFENEITAHLAEKGAGTFVDILANMSVGGKKGEVSDVYSKLPEKWSIKVSHQKIEKILNYSISEKEVKDILSRMGCEVSVDSGVYSVILPFERLDMVIEEDVIDEVGRVNGLDKIKSILPKVKVKQGFSAEFIISEKIKDFLDGLGFSEVQNRSFAKKGDLEVAHPMAKDKAFLRTSLQEGIKDSMDRAMLNAPILGLDKVQIFELGKVFDKSGERLQLAVVIDHAKKIKNKDVVIKNELEEIVKSLEDKVGSIMKNIKIDKNVLLADIAVDTGSEVGDDLSGIEMRQASRNIFKQFSNEPFIVRDIALFVSSNTDMSTVEKTIQSSLDKVAGDLFVKGPDLFDQFEKEGKKSLAFRMIFQAMDRTLSDAEVNGFMDSLYSEVKKQGWEVR